MKKLVLIMAAVILSCGCFLLAYDEAADDAQQKEKKKGDYDKSCMTQCEKNYNICMSPIAKALAAGKQVDEDKITKKCNAEKASCISGCKLRGRDDSK
jgi:hypothetical protein